MSVNGRRRSRGFTLLEVLVAAALMATLAVLCWRGLEAVIRARDHIEARADEVRALSVAFTQLDEDLRRSWPVRNLRQRQPPLTFASASDTREEPALMLLREGGGPEGLRLQQVVYRLRGGVLERGFSPWRAGGFDTALALDRLSWQPLINGVQGVAFRAWVPGTGWLAGSALLGLSQPVNIPPNAPPGLAPPRTVATAAPSGIELTLNRNGQRIVRLFAIGD